MMDREEQKKFIGAAAGRSRPKLDPLEQIVGRAPIRARHDPDGIVYIDPSSGSVVTWTMVHAADKPKEQRRFDERQRFIAIMDADGYGVLWS